MDIHNPFQFKVGDQVKVVRDVAEAESWYGNYTAYHKAAVGSILYVRMVDFEFGYMLSAKNSGPADMSWPSCALELVPAKKTAEVDVPSQTAPAELKKPRAAKPRTKSSGSKPWDSAACTHLRWYVMGIVKAKLTMRVTELLDGDGTPMGLTSDDGRQRRATVTVRCNKCDTVQRFEMPTERPQ